MEEAWTGPVSPTARQFGGYPCSRLWRCLWQSPDAARSPVSVRPWASGAEAVGTLVKDSMKDEDKEKENGGAGRKPE